MGFRAQVWYHCRISPPCFLAECRKRRLNQGSFVVLYFNLSALSDLYLVFACLFSCTVYLVTVCLFSCTALFVSISEVIGCEDRLQNDLYCVGWGVKLCSTSTKIMVLRPHHWQLPKKQYFSNVCCAQNTVRQNFTILCQQLYEFSLTKIRTLYFFVFRHDGLIFTKILNRDGTEKSY